MTSTTFPSHLGARPAGTSSLIVLYRPAWQRAAAALAGAWRRWREDARQRAAIRHLRTLDRRLLNDVGLGEFASEATPAWRQIESRW